MIDDAFEINKDKDVVASLYSKKTGILMEVKTNQLAVVVFTHPEFPELPLPKHVKYKAYPSICFECQNFPDAPNKKHFPSSLLKPGEDYKNTATYKFTTIT
jgi:aldose 1-epimerase